MYITISTYIPDYESLMLPTLHYEPMENKYGSLEIIEHLEKKYNLSQDTGGSGLSRNYCFIIGLDGQFIILKGLGLLESKRTGFYKISKRGLDTLTHNPTQIDVMYLKNHFPKFRDFIYRLRKRNTI